MYIYINIINIYICFYRLTRNVMQLKKPVKVKINPPNQTKPNQ